ncbi:MAG TPA: hypothetical protein ENK31_05880 [Nannocystis exedens]|nr:hypothetical protein [Nannocystis exedens]
MFRSARSSLVSLLALVGLVALSSPGRADEPERRWPLWPSEVTQVAAPLLHEGDARAPESERRAALSGLHSYATPLVAPYLLIALTDPSPQIRRAALQSCAHRQLTSCIDPALRIWSESLGDLSGRLYSLRVILLEPNSEHVEILLSALHSASPLLRIEAARLLGITALDTDDNQRARAALVAKLSDPDAEVRRAVARSLGLLAASEATLVLARMLDDPDPQLRRDAAEALAMIGDPRALPAMLRSLERGDEAYVARMLLQGLIQQPGAEVDRRLLGFLDGPPRGLKRSQIARALGQREDPSPLLLDGILMLLRESDSSLQTDLLNTLLHLGDPALPAIRSALARGVAPELAIELDRLLRARNLPKAPPPQLAVPAFPSAEERGAWRDRLDRRHADRFEAAAALGSLSPAWLSDAVRGSLRPDTDTLGEAPWLIALATCANPAVDTKLWSAILRRATEPQHNVSDRCLAIAALGRMPKSAESDFGKVLPELAADPKSAIRSCAALALAGRGNASATATLASLLSDTSPRVRSAAALALRTRPSVDERLPIDTQLAWTALNDADGRVRNAANLPRIDPGPATKLLIRAADPQMPGWMPVQTDTRQLWIPSQRMGPISWALVHDPQLRPVADSS